jgi:hypothetical protein
MLQILLLFHVLSMGFDTVRASAVLSLSVPSKNRMYTRDDSKNERTRAMVLWEAYKQAPEPLLLHAPPPLSA